ncbi:MAG: GtrA family protein [Patescibacteria group bacterium]
MVFSKKDFYFSIITGCITGFAAWQIFNFLDVVKFKDISFAWLLLFIPVLWIMGVNFGYFLGKWLTFFNQFGKFAAIGFTNAAVDFGVLNLLIANTGISAGGWYPVFKAISFVSAIIPSYFWNKYWAFESAEGGGGFEFAKFMSVAIVSILINDGLASLIVNFVDPFRGLSPAVWANIGAVAGSAVALIFSFVGFKVAVFKK